MTSGRGRNVGASVRVRLGNLARDQGVAFDYLRTVRRSPPTGSEGKLSMISRLSSTSDCASS